MLPSAGGRRLALLIHRTAAATVGATNPLQPQLHPHAARLSHHYYSSTPLPRTPDPEPCNTASYLVASCGFSPAAGAAAASRGIRIHSTAKADAVLALLRRNGFSDAHVARLLRMAPKLLLLDPDRVTRPKLEFFASLGLPAAVLTHSNVLERSLNKHIVPCIEFLRGILGSEACIRSAASRNPCVFRCDPEKIMRPAVEALRHHGLTKEAISKLVVRQVGVLAMAPGRIACIFEDLEELGLPITDPRFFEALCAMCSLSREKWLRKVSVYQSFGVPADVVLKAFKARPRIMSISEGNIKKKLRFFVDELKLDPNDVMGRARVIVLSLEKNILPRCAVLSVLMEEGKIGRDTKLLTSLIYSSKIFSEKYILRYADDVPDVLKAYEGKIKFEGFRDRML